jgi:hypothetical protein
MPRLQRALLKYAQNMGVLPFICIVGQAVQMTHFHSKDRVLQECPQVPWFQEVKANQV